MKQWRPIDDTRLWELKELWERKREALNISEPATDLTAIELEYQRQQWQTNGKPIPREIRHYVMFSSSNPRFAFTFLYPEVWEIRIFEEEEHGEVFILGPRNDADTYNLALAVHVFPSEEKGGKHADLSQVVADRLERSKDLPNFQEISKAQGSLGGVEALEFEISYTMPLLTNGLKDTLVLERRIILKRAGRFYELIYRAVEQDYYAYLESFKDVVRTFEFRESRVVRTYRPLVQTPAYIIREKPEPYETDE